MGNSESTVVASSASEGVENLKIGAVRDDEKFGRYIYRHEVVHGITYPPGQTQEKIDLMRDSFKTRPGDVFVATFPKSGTTWTQQVLMLLKNRGEQGDIPVMRAIPWIERLISAEGQDGIDMLNKVEGHTADGGRWFKAHSPYQFIPKGSGVKYIVATRNPKDTMVSMFHHARSKVEFQYEGDWNNWYEIFLKGKCESGDWFDFTLGYWNAAKEDPSAFLFFTFEEMKRDPKSVIRKIANFVEIPYDDALIDLVAEKSSFKAMKNNPLANCSQVAQKGLPHMRKGEVGDWKNYFTVAQSEAFDELNSEKMLGKGLNFEYVNKQ